MRFGLDTPGGDEWNQHLESNGDAGGGVEGDAVSGSGDGREEDMESEGVGGPAYRSVEATLSISSVFIRAPAREIPPLDADS